MKRHMPTTGFWTLLTVVNVLENCEQSDTPKQIRLARRSYIVLMGLATILLAMPSLMLGQTGQGAVPHDAIVVGTVTDVNHDTVPDATVVLQGATESDRQSVMSNGDGYFELRCLKPRVPYQVNISANGFAEWHSSALVLAPGQFKILANIELRIEAERTTIDVKYDPVQVATEQIKVEEQQRIFGFIPNYYVVYDPHPEPLSNKLKFHLAFKVLVNPVTVAGVALQSAAQQAGDTPNYSQGAAGFGKRFGANAADGLTNIVIGGAVLPSLLHQDPRYFYQGTGTTGSRIRHAIIHPFVCKGDNGAWQPNYSTIGGDLASSAISNLYYPKSNRGAGLVFTNFVLSSAGRVAASLAQEFILRRVTHKPGE
jgi:Carboxypeptidase regulatory-like domain